MANPSDRAPSAFESPADSRSFPRLSAARPDDKDVQSIISKLVSNTDRREPMRVGDNRAINAPDMGLLQKIGDLTSTNVLDANSLFQLLPDTELAMQILVSSTLSPKDMVSIDLNFTVDPQVFDGVVAGTLIDKVKDYFTNVYKITDLLPRILQDVLFFTGSYPLMILPENTIDDAINSPARVSMESVRGEFTSQGAPMAIGLLGNPPSADSAPAVGLESWERYTRPQDYSPTVKFAPNVLRLDPLLTVTDNPNALKMPFLKDKIQQDRIQDVLAARKIGMESHRYKVSMESGGAEKEASLYRRRRYKNVPVLALTPGDRLKKAPQGHPLVMKLPSECVIPVHVPSNPEEHLGYFVLLDPQGNPLVHAQISDYYNDMSANLVNNQEMVSQLINTTKRAERGRDPFRKEDIDELTRIYTDLVEQDLMARLKSGVYGDNVALGKPQEVYRIMLARAAAKMHTQVLYVPRELMTYVAFDYNQYGVGTSLIQNAKIIAGIRAMLLFSNTMAAIKNSVGRTGLNITLDPNDPDPSKTVEFLFHEYIKNRQGSYPLGASNPRDIVDFLQNAGVEVAVSGNAAYPETKLEVENKQSNVTKPDQDLENTIRERYLMALGLTPETVDAGAHAEFATTVVQNNLLLSKRVMIYQKLLTTFVAEFIQKYVLNSSYLMDELRELIRDNYDQLTSEQREDAKETALKATGGQPIDKPSVESESAGDPAAVEVLLMQFVNAIEVSLPSPDTATLETQMKAFDQYVEALDKAISAYIDASFLDSTTLGEMSEVVESTKASVRAHFIRQWLRNNNVLQELDDLTTYSDDGQPALDMLEASESHAEALGKAIEPFMKKMLEAKQERDKRVEAMKAQFGDIGGSTPAAPSDTSTSAASDTGGSADDGLGGMDDLDLGTDLGGDTGGDKSGTSNDELDLDAALGTTGTTEETPAAEPSSTEAPATSEAPTETEQAPEVKEAASAEVPAEPAAPSETPTETPTETPAEATEPASPTADQDDADLELTESPELDTPPATDEEEVVAGKDEGVTPSEQTAEDEDEFNLDKHLHEKNANFEFKPLPK